MARELLDHELKDWLQRLCKDEALELIPGRAGVLYEMEQYQYHRIMHRWVKGDEHMRMLVYMIGTMQDKLVYLGEMACNDQEKALIPLMEYRPFRFFSPIDESLDGWYPDTSRGYETMKAVAEKAGDTALVRLMKLGRVSGHLLDRKISRHLSCSRSLFSLIYEKIRVASERYRPRTYGSELQNDLNLRRKDIHHRFMQSGFAGTYPVYTREQMQVTVYEEHPFTVSEMDEMAFDVHFLVCDRRNKRFPYRALDPEEFFYLPNREQLESEFRRFMCSE